MSRAMKDSGIPWIGEIPSHWTIQRLQTQLSEINEKNSPIKTDFVLSLTNTRGVIPYTEKGDIGNKSKDNHEEYKIAYPHTIIANSMNILIGSVGICNYYGCVSPVYYIFKVRDGADLRYFNYLFSCQPFQKHLRQYANGILEIRLRLSCKDILQRSVPTPSFREQQSIADFLDKKCGEIDEMVLLQERIVDELKAYKQSVITEAVCNGLNPNVPTKNSGIKWIGECPENWKCARVKDLCAVISKGATPPTIDEGAYEGNIRFIKCENISNNELVNNSCYYISPQVNNTMRRSQLEENDVLFVIAGATIGKTAIVKKEFLPSNTNQAVSFLRLRNTASARFLWYVLQSNVIQAPLWVNAVQSAQPNLSMEDLGNFHIPFPPINEQQLITNYLDIKCNEIDALISLKLYKIDALKEYKKSIIYEYITGKKVAEA